MSWWLALLVSCAATSWLSLVLVWRFASDSTAADFNRAYGFALEMLAYADRPAQVWSCLADSLVHWGRACRGLLVPMLLSLPLWLLAGSWWGAYYRLRPLRPGQAALITIQHRGGLTPSQVSGPGLDGARFAEETRLVLGFRSQESSSFLVQTAPVPCQIPVTVGELGWACGTFSRTRWSRGLQYLNPAGASILPAQAEVESISIHYPVRLYELAGVQWPWWMLPAATCFAFSSLGIACWSILPSRGTPRT